MTTCTGTICHTPERRGAGSMARTGPARLWERLIVWSERARRRHELRQVLDMPEHLLRDMGITREEVYREYRKPFWQA